MAPLAAPTLPAASRTVSVTRTRTRLPRLRARLTARWVLLGSSRRRARDWLAFTAPVHLRSRCIFAAPGTESGPLAETVASSLAVTDTRTIPRLSDWRRARSFACGVSLSAAGAAPPGVAGEQLPATPTAAGQASWVS